MKPGDREPIEWVRQIQRKCGAELRRKGKEFAGPCPLCGGTDRFHVAPKAQGRGSMIGCRKCKSSFGEFCQVIWESLAERAKPPRSERSRQPDQTWDICYPDGQIAAKHLRWNAKNGGKKAFGWSRNGQRGLGGLPVKDLPLYRSERIYHYRQDLTLFVVEGEAAADTLYGLGAQVLGTVTGAASCPSGRVWSTLGDFKDCVLWPDHDGAGDRHMKRCAAALRGANPQAAIRILAPEDLGLDKPGSDAVEWVEQCDRADRGRTRESILAELIYLVESSARVFDGDTCDSCDSRYSSVDEADDEKKPSPAPVLESYDVEPKLELLAPEPEIPFPVDAFPPLLQEAALAIESLTRAPMALCAQSVLAVASVAAQGIADVELPTGQKVPLSLFLLSIAQSGERKSSVDRWATQPLQEEEERQEEQVQKDLAIFEATHEAWKIERNAAKKSTEGDIRTRLEALGPEPKRPHPAGLLVDMGTMEGILSMLQRRDSVGLFSDEGGSFLNGYAMARENDRRTKTATVLSSLWDGKPIREERRGGSLRLRKGKRMALHLLVQPVIAQKLLADREMEGQGFLSRLLIVEPKSTIGSRFWQPAPESARVALRIFTERIGQIFAMPRNRTTLTLSGEAASAWVALHDELEEQIGQDGELEAIRSFAAKTPEHATRIASVLALFENPGVNEISSLNSGVALAKFYLNERLRLFGKLAEPYAEDAQRLALWLKEKWPEDWISLSDILQNGPNRYRRERSFVEKKLLPLLEGAGHIKGPPQRAKVQGRVRRQAYRVTQRGKR